MASLRTPTHPQFKVPKAFLIWFGRNARCDAIASSSKILQACSISQIFYLSDLCARGISSSSKKILEISMTWRTWSIAVRAARRTSCGEKTGLRRHFSSFAKIFTHHHPTALLIGLSVRLVWKKKQIVLVAQNGTGASRLCNRDHRDCRLGAGTVFCSSPPKPFSISPSHMFETWALLLVCLKL